MLNINNKIIKLEDFNIYNPSKLQKELELLENNNIFVLDDKFYVNLQNYISNEMSKRVKYNSYDYYNSHNYSVTNFFKKLYSNAKNVNIKSILSYTFSGAACYLGFFGLQNSFAPIHGRSGYAEGYNIGYDKGYRLGQMNMGRVIMNYSANSSAINISAHSSLNNLVNQTVIQEKSHEASRFSQDLLQFVLGTLTSTLIYGSIINILGANKIYDEYTSNLNESLSIVSKKRELLFNNNLKRNL